MVTNQFDVCIQKKKFITILQGREINTRKIVHSVQHNLLPRTNILMKHGQAPIVAISTLLNLELLTSQTFILLPATMTYLPTKFSSTLLFPALCPPTTTICGNSKPNGSPLAENASCNWFTIWIRFSIPLFPASPGILGEFVVKTIKITPVASRQKFITYGSEYNFIALYLLLLLLLAPALIVTVILSLSSTNSTNCRIKSLY